MLPLSFRCQFFSGSFGLVELQLVDHAGAHDALLDLAGDGHRQLVDETDVARNLL